MAAVRRGLTEVQLSGRFQFVPGKPQWILDVAHNPHAARALAQNLASLPPCTHTYAVFAMLKDKDVAGVVECLKPYINTWLLAGITAPRGASSEELHGVLQAASVQAEVVVFDVIAHAVAHACNVAGENDRILVFGSFYTVAEAMVAKKICVY
jgi:dihydrofolate synthase/folylpolyglutamate synthase